MGGPTVNTQAQQAEQQNQQQAQQYAQQQQAAALAGVNNWTAQNKPPGQTAQPISGPQASSAQTMGGGNFGPGAQMASKNGQGPPQPGPSPSGQPTISPQMRQALMAALGGQGGAMARPPGM